MAEGEQRMGYFVLTSIETILDECLDPGGNPTRIIPVCVKALVPIWPAGDGSAEGSD